MLHPRNPPNRKTQIPGYKYDSDSEFVPRDTEQSELVDLAVFRDAAFAVDIVIYC